MPIASLKPLRKTAPSSAISARVIGTSRPCRNRVYGFSIRWAEASAAERVMVITKPVATKPSNASTKSLPCHHGRSRSSIEIEPSPCGLSRATRPYIGSAPNRVISTSTSVASGASGPAASAAIPGW